MQIPAILDQIPYAAMQQSAHFNPETVSRGLGHHINSKDSALN